MCRQECVAQLVHQRQVVRGAALPSSSALSGIRCGMGSGEVAPHPSAYASLGMQPMQCPVLLHATDDLQVTYPAGRFDRCLVVCNWVAVSQTTGVGCDQPEVCAVPGTQVVTSSLTTRQQLPQSGRVLYVISGCRLAHQVALAASFPSLSLRVCADTAPVCTTCPMQHPFSGFGMMARYSLTICLSRILRVVCFMSTVLPSPRPGCYRCDVLRSQSMPF